MSQSKRTPGALRRARTSDSLWCAERCAPATSRVAVRRWPAAGQRACHAHEWVVRSRIIYKNESDATKQINRSPSDLAVFSRQADSQPGPTPLNFAPGSSLSLSLVARPFADDAVHLGKMLAHL